jgi:hypothetical protein
MNQLAINFDFTPRSAPFQRHSSTSKAAALSAEPMAGTKRAILLGFLRGRGAAGATDEEMQTTVPMNPNTQRPRRVELVQGTFVVDSGRTRKTAGGDEAVVWVACEFSKATFNECTSPKAKTRISAT